MKKVYRKIHLWLSLPAGVIIFTTCLTGAMLVFQQEILEMAHPSHYFVKETKGPVLPLEELIPLVNSQLENNSVESVQIPPDPSRTYTMKLKEGFRISAFVDPYTGEVTGYYKFRETPFYPVMRLHRWLMDSTRTWGKYAVGISTLFFIPILASGILILLPIRLKKNRWIIHTRKGWRRFWFDIHTVLGLYAGIFLIVLALTGLMWSFEWYRNGVFKLFGADTEQATAEIWRWVRALHVGDFWGIWSKILVFTASLIGASLPLTGYWFYYKKRFGRK